MSTEPINDGVIKPTDFVAQRDALRHIIQTIQDLERYLNALKLEDDVIVSYAKFKEKLNQVTIASIGKPVEAVGDMVDKKTMQAAITKATGLGCWRGYRIHDKSLVHTATEIKNNYNLVVDPKRMISWEFTRDTNDRNQIFLVIVTVFPGHILIEDLATDRASGFSCLFSTMEAMKKWLAIM